MIEKYVVLDKDETAKAIAMAVMLLPALDNLDGRDVISEMMEDLHGKEIPEEVAAILTTCMALIYKYKVDRLNKTMREKQLLEQINAKLDAGGLDKIDGLFGKLVEIKAGTELHEKLEAMFQLKDVEEGTKH